uniref:Uncharacterized protein n=1 Tax=Amphimedon queenslandica TaxID=400682 RepID=A0A1X7V8I1_AMPQE
MVDIYERMTLLLILLYSRRMKRIRRRTWICDIMKYRTTPGEYHSFIQEMRLVDNESFYWYFHMTPMTFEGLLRRVGPSISPTTTQLRDPIHPGEGKD